MKIRPYAAADAHALAAIHEEVYPERPRSAAQFNRRLGNIHTVDGNAWVIGDDTHVIGYAAAAPEPGLDGVMAMEGLIAPRRQRQGMGSRLLQHLLRELEAAGAKQASYCVEDLDSPAACFLRQHDFYEEHVEWIMELVDWDAFRVQQEAATLRTYPRSEAIRLFLSLYDDAFEDLPWYQPYTTAETASTLTAAADLLFLVEDDSPIGFAWIRSDDAGKGEIEPLGIVKDRQGQGYGKTLIQASLARLAQRGCNRVEIGIWKDNTAALNLYRSEGFKRQQTLTYLARDLA